jgi:hypothetical protein
MQEPDADANGDAAFRQMLALAAEQTNDPVKKQAIADFLATLRPIAEWSPDERDVLVQTCRYIISLGRMGRALEQLNPPD